MISEPIKFKCQKRKRVLDAWLHCLRTSGSHNRQQTSFDEEKIVRQILLSEFSSSGTIRTTRSSSFPFQVYLEGKISVFW